MRERESKRIRAQLTDGNWFSEVILGLVIIVSYDVSCSRFSLVCKFFSGRGERVYLRARMRMRQGENRNIN